MYNETFTYRFGKVRSKIDDCLEMKQSVWKYSTIPLLRPLLWLFKSGLTSGVVLILNIEYSKCPKISN